jgi:hypothetical protein
MPVLEVGGQFIPEGLAAMRFLDETLPGPALSTGWPARAGTHAHVHERLRGLRLSQCRAHDPA